MAIDLPGIRARAEWNLEQFRQQEAQILESLRNVSAQMRAVPAARILIDTSAAKQQVQSAVSETKNAQDQITETVRRGARQRVSEEEKAAKEAIKIARGRVKEMFLAYNEEKAAVEAADRAKAKAAREAATEVEKALKAEEKARRDAARLANQIAKEIEQDARRAAAAEKKATQERIDDLRRAVKEQEQFAQRQKAIRDRTIRDEAASARQNRGEERRENRAELGVGVGAAAFGAVFAEGLREATGAAADFAKAMSQVRAVLSPKELAESGEKLEALALSLGSAGLGANAIQAAAALEAMSKAGISAEDQLKGAPAVLALAAAGGLELAEAADIASNALTTFGKTGGEQLANVANVLVGVANATTTDVAKLRLSLQQVGAVAAISNQSIESTAIALGLMARAGIRSSDAGTSLRVMLTRLQPDTEKQIAIFQRYGIIADGANKFIDESTGKFKDLSEVAEVLKVALGNATDAEQQFALKTLFGQDAVRAGIVLMRSGAEGFANLGQEALEQGDALGVAAERMNNLRGDLTKLDAEWKKVQITFGKGLEADLRGPAQQLTNMLKIISETSPEIRRAGLIIAGSIAAIFGIGGAAVTAGAGIKLMGLTLGAAATAAAGILLPIVAVTAAVALLGIAWVNNWGDIQGKTSVVAGEVSKLIQTIITDLETLKELASVPFKFGTDATNNDPALDFFNTIVAKAKELGEQSGIDFGEALKRGLLSSLPLGGGALIVHDFLQSKRDEKNRVAEEQAANQPSRVSDETFQGAIAALDSIGKEQQEVADNSEQSAEKFKNSWERALKAIDRAGQDLGKAFALAGTDTEVIQVLLEMDRAAGIADAGFKKLADQGLVAALIAQQNYINSIQDATSRITAQIALGEQYRQHLEAQAKSEKDAADAQKLADDIRKTGSDLFEQRARSLISSTYPALNAQSRELVEIKLKEGQAFQALQFAVSAVGGDLSQLNDIMNGTDSQAKDFGKTLSELAENGDAASRAFKLTQDAAKTFLDSISKQLPIVTQAQIEYARVTEGTGPAIAEAYKAVGLELKQLPDFATLGAEGVKKLTDEFNTWLKVADPVANALKITDDRTKSFLSTVIDDMPAATKAQLEMVAAVSGPLEALRQAYKLLGLDISAIPDLANASAAQVKNAQDRIESAKTGKPTPAAQKAKDASDTFQKDQQKANSSLTKAIKEFDKSISAAKKKHADAVKSANNDLLKAEEQFAAEMARIEEELASTLADINRDTAKAFDTYNKGMLDLDIKEKKLLSESVKAQKERAEKFVKSNVDLQNGLAKTIRDINKSISDAVKAATRQQRDQLLQLSQSLANLRTQESDVARSSSVQLADLANKELKATTAEERSQLAQERIQIQADQGAAAVALQKQITQGQAGLHKTVEDIQADLLAQIAELQQQATDAVQETNKQLKELKEEFIKAEKEAADTLKEQLLEIKQQRGELENALQQQLAELQRRRVEAQQQAAQARAKAQQALDEAREKHREAMAKADEQLAQDEREAREALYEAALKHQEDMAAAAERLAKAQEELQELVAIKLVNQEQLTVLNTIAEQRRPFVVNMNNSNIEEGDVEFLERAAEVAEELAQAPIG